MSTVKISELTALTSADAADELVIVDDSAGVTKKITHANLANFGTGTVTAGAIDFSGLANAAGMTSEVLDDYEEGTWTPTWVVSGGTITPASFATRGRYVKVGQAVYIWGFISYASHSGSPTGNLRVGGFPYSANLTYGQQNAGNFCVSWSALWSSNPPFLGNLIASSPTEMYIYNQDSTGTLPVTFADMTTSSNNSQIAFFGAYPTT